MNHKVLFVLQFISNVNLFDQILPSVSELNFHSHFFLNNMWLFVNNIILLRLIHVTQCCIKAAFNDFYISTSSNFGITNDIIMII